MTSHLSKKINMLWQFHHMHVVETASILSTELRSLYFSSSGLSAISSNKMSWSSGTMWPSNNTLLWLHLLMGEK